ncbi:hypothetical protein [Afipia birgiae]|uniref:hypothetical protein n=1 Tax=Afipia birgiae TaxID=151414 RepID=UPI0002E59C15|nr:hypothetical protein [Afipia birgiae]
MMWAERADQKPEGNIRRSVMRGDLNALSSFFEETGNSAAAWLCWHLAQKWQMPAPAAVADEINRFAGQIAALAIEALDGNARTVIDGDAVAALWAVSPGRAKDGTRRGSTGLAEQLRIWDRDIAVAIRVHELRSAGATKEAALETVNEEMGVGVHNADRIAKKYRNEFLAAEAEAKEEDR